MKTLYTVVLADDVAALRRLVRLGLERSRRFQVVGEAADGVEAVRVAEEKTPDLVLLDLSMPAMDGLEALPAILAASPRSRVVVFSGFNHVRMGPVATRLGASAYLEKGLTPAQMVHRLLEVVEGNPVPALEPETTRPPEVTSILLVSASQSFAETIHDAMPAATLERRPDSEAAVAALAGRTFDVALLDGEQAGDEALLALLGHASKLPVIILTDDQEAGRRALALGAEDCLPRGHIDPAILRRAALYAVERRQGREARLAAREQARHLERLRELEEAKTQFFNAAAHELSTPLTPIKLQLHLLRAGEESLPLEHRRALSILDRNLDRLTELTRDLLDVARLQAGRLQLETEALDLGALAREAAETFEPLAIRQGVRLEVKANGVADARGDTGRIAQVLYNLISNAVKYTPAGGWIRVETLRRDGGVGVSVRDSGIGFTGDQKAHLFEPFSRLHEGTPAAGQGTGLGLYVSKGLVELHGGRIWAASDGPGRGATFGFLLPTTTSLAEVATAA